LLINNCRLRRNRSFDSGIRHPVSSLEYERAQDAKRPVYRNADVTSPIAFCSSLAVRPTTERNDDDDDDDDNNNNAPNQTRTDRMVLPRVLYTFCFRAFTRYSKG